METNNSINYLDLILITHKNIEFTYEMETNNSINYLDLILITYKKTSNLLMKWKQTIALITQKNFGTKSIDI